MEKCSTVSPKLPSCFFHQQQVATKQRPLSATMLHLGILVLLVYRGPHEFNSQHNTGMECLLETLDLVESGDASYLQHHVRAAGYWDNVVEKCCISQNTDNLSREETQEHTSLL